MSNETITRIVVFISSLISFSSASIALLSGGDIFFVIVVRFLGAFFMSAIVVWTALSIINSTIINAAAKHIDDLRDEFAKEDAEKLAQGLASAISGDINKGQNLDITTDAPIDFQPLTPTVEQPKIAEFEPFKPERIESDIAE